MIASIIVARPNYSKFNLRVKPWLVVTVPEVGGGLNIDPSAEARHVGLSMALRLASPEWWNEVFNSSLEIYQV